MRSPAKSLSFSESYDSRKHCKCYIGRFFFFKHQLWQGDLAAIILSRTICRILLNAKEPFAVPTFTKCDKCRSHIRFIRNHLEPPQKGEQILWKPTNVNKKERVSFCIFKKWWFQLVNHQPIFKKSAGGWFDFHTSATTPSRRCPSLKAMAHDISNPRRCMLSPTIQSNGSLLGGWAKNRTKREVVNSYGDRCSSP